MGLVKVVGNIEGAGKDIVITVDPVTGYKIQVSSDTYPSPLLTQLGENMGAYPARTLTSIVGVDANGLAGLGSATIRRPAQAGPALVCIGDSIPQADEDSPNGLHANSYITYAMAALNGRLNILNLAGIGGQTSTQVLARFATDVLAYSPSICDIMCGTNDTIPLTQTLPNFTAMISQLLLAGIQPILNTVPPAGMAAISAPSPAAVGAITGGTLAAATYSYRVSAINGVGETLAAAGVTGTVASGTTGKVTITWAAVEGATGYKIYGRTAGTELLIATVGATVLSGQARAPCGYVDTGSVTPSGALPGANTTAVALSGTVRTKINQVNSIISGLAKKYNIPLVDHYAMLVDPTTGMFRTGYTKDGTHPTPKAYRLMGQLWASTLTNFISTLSPYLAYDNSDGAVLYTNPLFTNNDGAKPSGFGASGGSGVCETITTDAAVAGSVWQIAPTDFNGRNYSGPSGNISGVAAGDKLALTFKLKVTGADTGGGQLDIKLKNQANTQFFSYFINSDTPSDTWATYYFECTAPASTTAVYFALDAAYGPITAQIGQLTLRNLTTYGIN